MEMGRGIDSDSNELVITGAAKGGDGIARDANGRVVFVAGALPGETVAVELTEAKRDFARARIVSVLSPSPDRVAPPCPLVAAGCGGCDLQHLASGAQPGWKGSIVAEAAARIGKFDMPPMEVHTLPSTAYRTTVHGLVRDGRFAFRARSSHDAIAVDSCLVAHPLLDELMAIDYGAADEVTLRAGSRTGERLAWWTPKHADVSLPSNVAVGERAVFHEEVAGVRFRVSARSFFQARPDGADVLVELARQMVAGIEGPAVDLYGGVGLFAATALADRDDVTVVEHSASSVRDCAVNAPRAHTRRMSVEKWKPTKAAVVVADPSREGLGRLGVMRVAETTAPRVVLVSCDPAAWARDVKLLIAQGYAPSRVALVDLFGHTSHIELVTQLDRQI